MNILIVSYVDDNFGDILIRICFEELLKVVLKNLNIKEYNIYKMSLKNIDKKIISDSNIIFFAGGGLFGLSYLNFFEYLDKITKVAEENAVPVIFSSIGVNNMDATIKTENMLRSLLKRKCIKAISVRENLELFNYYVENSNIKISEVCDPAVWTKHIYAKELKSNTKKRKKIIGINVVRGGLFKDNKNKWGLNDELEYLNQLKNLLDNSEYDYKFYTNGSILDNNTLRYFAKKYNISEDKIIFVNSTRDLVKTINEFDFVIAIRMHSSIISYALEIPMINLIWNEKIKHFYSNINRPNYAISLNEWNADNIFNIINDNINKNNANYDKKYLMTLYKYIYNTLKNILNINKESKIYSFNEIIENLGKTEISIEEDLNDYKMKIFRAENFYLERFIENLKKTDEIKRFNNTLKEMEELLKKEKESKEKIIKQAEERLLEINILKNNVIELEKLKNIEIANKNKKIDNLKNNIKTKNKIINQYKKEIERINNKFIVRLYRKTKKIIKKNKTFYK